MTPVCGRCLRKNLYGVWAFHPWFSGSCHIIFVCPATLCVFQMPARIKQMFFRTIYTYVMSPRPKRQWGMPKAPLLCYVANVRMDSLWVDINQFLVHCNRWKNLAAVLNEKIIDVTPWRSLALLGTTYLVFHGTSWHCLTMLMLKIYIYKIHIIPFSSCERFVDSTLTIFHGPWPLPCFEAYTT